MDERVALISGGSGGIGREIASAFAKENIRVILFSRNEDKLKKSVEELNVQREMAEYIVGDVCKINDILEAVQRIRSKYGKLDILVNCAGGGPVGGIQKITDEEWVQNISVKQLGYIRLTREALPLLIHSGKANIINIIGVFGKQPSKDFVVGSVTNAALMALTKAVADDVAGYGIRVNAINPGATNTGLWKETLKDLANGSELSPEEINQNIADMSPMHRIAEPKDIANLALFLVSDKAEFITGISINVDGGTYSGI